jgi:hypothetical protein
MNNQNNHNFSLPIPGYGIAASQVAKPVKRSIALGQSTANAIKDLSVRNGISENEVVSILVQRGLVIESVLAAGGNVTGQLPNAQIIHIADGNTEIVPSRLNPPQLKLGQQPKLPGT